MSENNYSFPVAFDAGKSPVSEGQLISFSEGISGAQFITIPATPSPKAIFRDMDNDGDLDIVIDNPSPSQPNWVENTLGRAADSIFSNTIFNRITPTVMAVGDIDGDGNEDVVIGHMSGAKIFYNHDGWAMEDLGAILNMPRTIVLDDINNDGEVDILIRDSKNLTLFQSHDGQLGTQNMSWPNLGDNPILGVGNFNLSTQAQEILVYQTHTSTLGVVAHNGITWQCFQSVSAIHPTKIVISDFNHDGADDVYIEDTDGNTVVLESNGEGRLSLSTDQSGLDKDLSVSPNSDELSMDDEEPCDSSAPPPPHMNFAPSPKPAIEPPAPDTSLNSVAETQADSMDNALDTDILTTSDVTTPSVEEPIEVTGTDHGDILFGASCSEQLNGQAGMDVIFAGGGDDTLTGGLHSDFLWGEEGDDSILGQHGNDIAFGGDGDDYLHGGGDEDMLFGGSGEDILIGGLGEDFMFGGAGNDTFLYSCAHEGNDFIFSFEKGKDVFQFEFGSKSLYNMTDDLSEKTGNGFLWESTGNDTGQLYFDPDLAVEGNELLLAEVEFSDSNAELTQDDISIV